MAGSSNIRFGILQVEGRDRGDEIGLPANAVARLGTGMRLAMERLNRQGPAEGR